MGYKSGELDVGKREIKEIIHKSLKGAIYLTAGDNLTWDEEENLCKHWYRATTEAINLLTPAKMTIKDPLERNRALKMLAAGLARALQATTPNPDEDFFGISPRVHISPSTRNPTNTIFRCRCGGSRNGSNITGFADYDGF